MAVKTASTVEFRLTVSSGWIFRKPATCNRFVDYLSVRILSGRTAVLLLISSSYGRTNTWCNIDMKTTQQSITLNYVEFKVRDIDQSKAFYGQAMGWAFTDYGESYCEFSDGHMKGGFELDESICDLGYETFNGPLVVLYCADLTEAKNRIELYGGKIVKPIFEFPGGRRFHFRDPDGYELAVWSDIQPGLKN